jgi:ribosomal protein L18E
LYKFLSRRTDSKFNAVIAKRLMKARRYKAPLSLQRLVKLTKGKETSRVAAVVGTVTDDARLYDMPKLSVCALRFTETARARIVKAGGECITFDQLALRNPTGTFQNHFCFVLLPNPSFSSKQIKMSFFRFRFCCFQKCAGVQERFSLSLLATIPRSSSSLVLPQSSILRAGDFLKIERERNVKSVKALLRESFVF